MLFDVVRAFQAACSGRAHDRETLDDLVPGGILSRFYRPLLRLIGRSWHMYPLGLLFGLGFDTATEVGLLGIAAIQAGKG